MGTGLSFHHVGPGDPAQVICFGSKFYNITSHLYSHGQGHLTKRFILGQGQRRRGKQLPIRLSSEGGWSISASSHGPQLGHLAKPNCKGGWRMWSLACIILECAASEKEGSKGNNWGQLSPLAINLKRRVISGPAAPLPETLGGGIKEALSFVQACCSPLLFSP